MPDRKDPFAVRNRKTVRYAVVGLGWIAQTAVLPAFAHARENCELVALVSSDPEKLRKLGRKYRVKHRYSYQQYDECLSNEEVDAVYIALPNTMHREYTERAAQAGVHVLCEKPMAVTEEECEAMISACRTAKSP
jgi:predicted dehydrogenase